MRQLCHHTHYILPFHTNLTKTAYDPQYMTFEASQEALDPVATNSPLSYFPIPQTRHTLFSHFYRIPAFM
jgi:hypothetical protein